MKSFKEHRQSITEASEVSIASLDAATAKQIRDMAKALSQFKGQLNLSTPQIFDGGMGKIASFGGMSRSTGAAVRVTGDTMMKLSKLRGVRWIDFSNDNISIGF